MMLLLAVMALGTEGVRLAAEAHPSPPPQRLHPRRTGAIRIKCGVQPM